MSNERSPQTQKNHPSQQTKQSEQTDYEIAGPESHSPLRQLQNVVGNHAINSMLKSGQLTGTDPRQTNLSLPNVRGVVQPKREPEESEDRSAEDAYLTRDTKGPLAGAPPLPPNDAHNTLKTNEPTIQRTLDEEQKKIWDEKNGDKIISDLKATVDTWKTWRKQPITYDGMPKGDGIDLSALSELVRLNGAVYGRHMASEIGGEAVRYLSEMAAFNPKFNLLIGVIPGVAHVEPNHKYEMRAVESNTFMAGSWPIGQLEVIYSNAFGWSWTKMLKGSFMSVEVSIGYNAEVEKKDGKRGIKKGIKGGLGVNIPGQISVNGKATAKHGAYWGLDDLGGAVHVVNGPSAKGQVAGFGKKASSGGIIQFVGNGGAPLSPITFDNFATEFTLNTETPKKPDDLKGAEASISIIEQGGGAVWSAGGGDSFAIPEPEASAVQSEKVWKYNIGPFETGSAALPGDAQVYLDMIKQDISAKQEEINAQRELYEQLGVDPSFKVEFMIEGFASRPWQTAGNDAQRKEKNQQLSQARADSVASQINGMFADVLGGITSVGRGAAVRILENDIKVEGGVMVKNKTTEKILAEDGNGDAIEAEIRKREEQYRKDFPFMSEAEIKKAVRANLGTSSEADDPFIRRVVVTAMWRGYEIQWGGAAASPAPVPRANQ